MGSDARLNEEDVLARFDRLVEEGTVVYNEDYRTVTVTDKGLPVKWNPVSTLSRIVSDSFPV